MKLKDKKAIVQSSKEELKNLLEKARGDLSLLNLDKVQNKLKNTRSIFLKRKEIALILTLVRQKELHEAMEVKKWKRFLKDKWFQMLWQKQQL